jgi:hypothetical protein
MAGRQQYRQAFQGVVHEVIQTGAGKALPPTIGRATMGDLLKFPTESNEEIIEYLIVLTSNVMARNKKVTNWFGLSREDCAEIDYINKHWLGYFHKAAKMGQVSQEDAVKIKAFMEWVESLCRFEFED